MADSEPLPLSGDGAYMASNNTSTRHVAWADDILRVCDALRKDAFVKIILSDDELECVKALYTAAAEAFSNRPSRLQLTVPELDEKRLDSRSGYVDGRTREFFELHDSVPHALGSPTAPEAVHLLEVTSKYSRACRRRCHDVLSALATLQQPSTGGLSPLGIYLASEARAADKIVGRASGTFMRSSEGVAPTGGATEEEAADPAVFAGFRSSMMRVYRYDEEPEPVSPPSEKTARVDDNDPHHDMGLLTLIPRGSCPGLEIQPVGTSDWLLIEKHMAPNEAILFGGLTLARLTGIPALYHRPTRSAERRMSAPFFLRASLRVVMPRSGKHEPEEVGEFHEALRDANEDDVYADGTVVVRKPSAKRRPPSPRRSSPPYTPRKHSRPDFRRRSGGQATQQWAASPADGAARQW